MASTPDATANAPVLDKKEASNLDNAGTATNGGTAYPQMSRENCEVARAAALWIRSSCSSQHPRARLRLWW